MNDYAGKKILITGGTSGIGRASALAFAAEGGDVTVTGLTDEEVSSFLNDSATAGIAAVKLDVSDSQAVKNLFASLDQLDILVNCAGLLGGPAEFEEEGFLRSMDVNINGTMRCCYAAKDLLARQGGAIVNTASVMSFFGSGTSPAYSASKGAVMQFTKSLAVSWADIGIRVNGVAPGFIDTPMTKALQADPEWNAKVVNRTPQGRWGDPSEIATGILFLASPKATFVTGVILPVDGGYIVRAVS